MSDDPFPGHARHRGKLAIPYLGPGDRVLSMRFRCIEDHTNCRDLNHGKYMGLTEETTRLYNVRAVKQAGGEIHIAEGELDAIILAKLGLHAVAVPGASNWKSHYRRVLAGFNRVWVWGDPDDAGAEFNRKVTRSLARAKSVRLREGDITDTYLAGGADALLSLIREDAAK